MSGASCNACARSSRPPHTSTQRGLLLFFLAHFIIHSEPSVAVVNPANGTAPCLPCLVIDRKYAGVASPFWCFCSLGKSFSYRAIISRMFCFVPWPNEGEEMRPSVL